MPDDFVIFDRGENGAGRNAAQLVDLGDVKRLDLENVKLETIRAFLSELVTRVLHDDTTDPIWRDQQFGDLINVVDADGNPLSQANRTTNTLPNNHPNDSQQWLFLTDIAYFVLQLAAAIAEEEKADPSFVREWQARTTDDVDNRLRDLGEATAPGNGGKINLAALRRNWATGIQEVANVALVEATRVIESAAPTEETDREGAGATTTSDNTTKATEEKVAEALLARRVIQQAAAEKAESGETTTEVLPTTRETATTATVPAKYVFTVPIPGEAASGVASETLEKAASPRLSAEQRRLYVTESAWITQGVLAQLFPDKIGRFDTLDPQLRREISDLVLEKVGDSLGRGDLGSITARIRAIQELKLTAMRAAVQRGALIPPVAVLAGEQDHGLDRQAVLESGLLDDLTDYLKTQTAAQGVPVTPEIEQQLRDQAYVSLTQLGTSELLAAASSPTVRTNLFRTVATTTPQSILAKSLAAAGLSLEAADLQRIEKALDVYVLQLAQDGKTAEEISTLLSTLSPTTLSDLTGLPTQVFATDVVRNALVAHTQQLSSELLVVRGEQPALTTATATQEFSRHVEGFAPTAQKLKDKTPAEEASRKPSSNAREKAKAYLKNYQNRWDQLTQEEQIVISLLAKAPVPKPFFSEQRDVNKRLPLPFGFIELEAKVYSPEVQELVRLFVKSPKRYQNRDGTEKLLTDWQGTKSPEVYQQFTASLQTSNLNKREQDSLAQLQHVVGYDYQELVTLYKSLPESDRQKMLAVLTADSEDANYTTSQFDTSLAAAAAAPVFIGYVDMGEPQGAAALGITTDDAESALEINSQEELSDFWANRGQGGKLPSSLSDRVRRGLQLKRKTSAAKLAKKVAASKAKDRVASGAAKAAGAAIGGPWGTAATLALSALKNKNLRNALGALGLAGIAGYLWALSRPLGMLFGVLGGWAGSFFGPLGALTGSVAGAIVGANITPTAWPSLFPARTAPGLSGLETPIEQQGLTSVRSATAANSLPNAATTQAVGLNSTIPVATATTAAAATSTAVAAIASGISAAAAPLIGLGTVVVLTISTFVVIWGAFLHNSPIAPLPANLTGNPDDLQLSAKYITVTKIANPTSFENGPGETVNRDIDVTYSIVIQPKPGYVIKLESLNDKFMSYADKDGQAATNFPNPSPLKLEDFPAIIASASATATYQANDMAAKDAYITNRLTVVFTAYDAIAYAKDPNNPIPVASMQTYITSETVTVGDPEMGCWPAAGKIVQTPFSNELSHSGSDAFDIVNVVGTPIYAPFPGTACAYPTGWNGGYGTSVRLYVDGIDMGQGAYPLQFVFGHFTRLADDLLENATCQLGPDRHTLVSGGRQVEPGFILGYMGNSGWSKGPHLHYELYTNRANWEFWSPLGGNKSMLELLVPDGPGVIDDQTIVTSCW